MSGSPERQYRVRYKNPTGGIIQEGVVMATSPRRAIDEYLKRSNREVTYVAKYSTWAGLRAAFYSQGGNCILCEVIQLYGEHVNLYLLYTQVVVK